MNINLGLLRQRKNPDRKRPWWSWPRFQGIKTNSRFIKIYFFSNDIIACRWQ